MQKYMKPCMKIGDFAKLCGTNKRTLMHYEEIDLFSPAYIDERGYRFYSETQCDVFSIILALKEIGMPLTQIKNYLDKRNPDALYKLLETQHKIIQNEIANLERIDLVIKTKLSLVEKSKEITINTVATEFCEEEYLILSPLIDSNEHTRVINTLYNHLSFCNTNNLNVGHPYGAMISCENLYKNKFDTYAYFFTKVISKPESIPYFTKKSGYYITTYLKGDYYNSTPAYNLLLDYAKANNLTITGYSFKEAIIDEVAEKSVDEYITKISIPIIS